MRPHPECCSFHTAQVCSALTGLLFCMGGHWLIISSHINFDLLIFASLFVVKLGKKLSLKDPGPLDLTIINWFVRESFTNHIARVTKPYLQASFRVPLSALNPKGFD